MNTSNRTSTPDRPRKASQHPNGRESLKKAADRTQEFLAEHPMTTMLTGFLLGFGTGLLMTACLGTRGTKENFATRWGHKMQDAVSGVLPQSWHR